MVYPVDVSTYRCYFQWIIANNLASANCIPTKLDTKMCPYTAYPCTKFQGIQITRFHLMATFLPWKKEEKTMKLSQFFESLYLGNASVTIWNVGTDGEGHLYCKNRPRKSSMKVWKLHYYSSCQYTHGCGTPATYASRHTTMYLDQVE